MQLNARKIAIQKIKLIRHLDRFDKVAVLDADSLVLQNIDEVLAWPSLSSSTNIGWGCTNNSELTSNLLVFEPDANLFKRIYDFMSVPTYKARVDHAILEEFFMGGAESGVHRLPSHFMAYVKACRCSDPGLVTKLGSTRAITFSEHPWEVRARGALFKRRGKKGRQDRSKQRLEWMNLSCPWTGDFDDVKEYRFDTPDSCSPLFYCRWFDVAQRAFQRAQLDLPYWWFGGEGSRPHARARPLQPEDER